MLKFKHCINFKVVLEPISVVFSLLIVSSVSVIESATWFKLTFFSEEITKNIYFFLKVSHEFVTD